MTILKNYFIIVILLLLNVLCIKGNEIEEDDFPKPQKLKESIDVDRYLKLLGPEEFNQHGQEGLWFIFYGSKTSIKSETFTYMWFEIQNQADIENITSIINLAKVECSKHAVFCKEQNIKHFPTLLLYNEGKKENEFKDYMNSDDVLNYIRKIAGKYNETIIDEDEDEDNDKKQKNKKSKGKNQRLMIQLRWI